MDLQVTGVMVTRRPEMPYPPLPSSKLPERINHTSLPPHRGRPRCVSTLASRLTTASSFAGLHYGCYWSGERSGRGACCDATRPMEKMPHPQLEPAGAGSK